MLEENFVQNIIAVHIRIKLVWQRSMYIRKMPDPDAFGLSKRVGAGDSEDYKTN